MAKEHYFWGAQLQYSTLVEHLLVRILKEILILPPANLLNPHNPKSALVRLTEEWEWERLRERAQAL